MFFTTVCTCSIPVLYRLRSAGRQRLNLNANCIFTCTHTRLSTSTKTHRCNPGRGYRWSVIKSLFGDGDGGGGDGEGGEGEGGGGEGEGGGGEGDTHPLHWRTSWTSALTRSNSARRSATAAIASEYPQVVGGKSGGGAAAPTLHSTQEAASNLSRRVHLVLGRRNWGLTQTL